MEPKNATVIVLRKSERFEVDATYFGKHVIEEIHVSDADTPALTYGRYRLFGGTLGELKLVGKAVGPMPYAVRKQIRQIQAELREQAATR